MGLIDGLHNVPERFKRCCSSLAPPPTNNNNNIACDLMHQYKWTDGDFCSCSNKMSSNNCLKSAGHMHQVEVTKINVTQIL